MLVATPIGKGKWDKYPDTVVTGSTYVVLPTDQVVVFDRVTAISATMMAATGSHDPYMFKNINTGTVTIDGDSDDTIDGVANLTLYQWESAVLVDYAANKWIIL
jgi:hypothetical protein